MKKMLLSLAAVLTLAGSSLAYASAGPDLAKEQQTASGMPETYDGTRAAGASALSVRLSPELEGRSGGGQYAQLEKRDKMKQYIVDTFASEIFHGNPAAVCIMDKWPSDSVIQSAAQENSLPETAFAVPEGDGYSLRWFTPGREIDLCGHATLATAFVLFNFYDKDKEKIVFNTMSGELTVTKKGELFEMDFPVYKLKKVPVTETMVEALGARPVEAYLGRDLVCVFESEEAVRALKIDLAKAKNLDGLVLNVTAPAQAGSAYDIVSRCFAPKLNVAEDPACGSGHCHIVPYWAKKLGKNKITAYQASARGGTLYCTVEGDRIKMAGGAVLYAAGEVFFPES